MSMSMNDEERLGYVVASSPRKEDGIPVPSLVEHGFVAFGPIWINPMDVKKASAYRVYEGSVTSPNCCPYC
jgi:hypothetical protein